MKSLQMGKYPPITNIYFWFREELSGTRNEEKILVPHEDIDPKPYRESSHTLCLQVTRVQRGVTISIVKSQTRCTEKPLSRGVYYSRGKREVRAWRRRGESHAWRTHTHQKIKNTNENTHKMTSVVLSHAWSRDLKGLKDSKWVWLNALIFFLF